MKDGIFGKALAKAALTRNVGNEWLLEIIVSLINQAPDHYKTRDSVKVASYSHSGLEELLKSVKPHSQLVEQDTLANLTIIEEIQEAQRKYALIEEETRKKTVIYYYVDHRQKQQANDYYIFTPDWVTVLRVPQSELGEGVLGVAYIGLNLIKVLNTLYGNDFVEVKKHELLHLQYPGQPEGWIRRRTTEELSFATRYQ